MLYSTVVWGEGYLEVAKRGEVKGEISSIRNYYEGPMNQFRGKETVHPLC